MKTPPSTPTADNQDQNGQLARSATPKAQGHEADNRCELCGADMDGHYNNNAECDT